MLKYAIILYNKMDKNQFLFICLKVAKMNKFNFIYRKTNANFIEPNKLMIYFNIVIRLIIKFKTKLNNLKILKI